jgi:hypothetical protein
METPDETTQQGPFNRAAKTPQEQEQTWVRLEELMKQGCYEEVGDSLMQERRMRKAVRKKRREGPSGYLLTAKEAMELSSLKRHGSQLMNK